jgi:flagellar hook assembly protein FlgD
VLGRQIRTLIASQHSVGRFQIVWDGTDEKHLPVAAGSYFYRMESGEFVKVIKLALVK